MNRHFCFGSALLFLCAAGFAQRGRGITSVEGFVGCSSAVYVGRIKSVTPTGDLPGVFPDRDGNQYRLEFTVAETIRGEKRESLSLHLVLGTTFYLRFLAKNETEVLLSVSPQRFGTDPAQDEGIEEGRSSAGKDYCAFRLLEPIDIKDPAMASAAQDLNVASDFGRMFRCDLSIVKGRDAIIKRARSFAKKHSEVFEPILLGLPNDFFDLVGYHNAFGLLTVPKCLETERMLVGILKDPGDLFSRYKTKDYLSDRN